METFEIFYKRQDGTLQPSGTEEHENVEAAKKSIKKFIWKERFAIVNVTLEGTNRLIVSRPEFETITFGG